MHTPTSTPTSTPTITPTHTPTATATVTPCLVTAPAPLTPEDSALVTEPTITFSWTAVTCATRYVLRIRRDSPTGAVVYRKKVFATEKELNTALFGNGKFYWRVKACNALNCSKRSARWQVFTIQQ